MALWLATAGRTSTRPDPSWDWWALVGAGVVFLLVRVWLRVPARPSMIAPALVGGLAVSAAIDTWGVVPVLGIGAIVILLGMRRAQFG